LAEREEQIEKSQNFSISVEFDFANQIGWLGGVSPPVTPPSILDGRAEQAIETSSVARLNYLDGGI
jgi:hypothetical protein